MAQPDSRVQMTACEVGGSGSIDASVDKWSSWIDWTMLKRRQRISRRKNQVCSKKKKMNPDWIEASLLLKFFWHSNNSWRCRNNGPNYKSSFCSFFTSLFKKLFSLWLIEFLMCFVHHDASTKTSNVTSKLVYVYVCTHKSAHVVE